VDNTFHLITAEVELAMSFKRSLSIETPSENQKSGDETSTDQSTTKNESVSVDQLKKHGIRRVSVDYFLIDGYRYTSIDDAIAQANRQR